MVVGHLHTIQPYRISAKWHLRSHIKINYTTHSLTHPHPQQINSVRLLIESLEFGVSPLLDLNHRQCFFTLYHTSNFFFILLHHSVYHHLVILIHNLFMSHENFEHFLFHCKPFFSYVDYNTCMAVGVCLGFVKMSSVKSLY